MPFLYKFTLGENKDSEPSLGKNELASIKYHDIFDYPLTTAEVIKWSVGIKGLTSFSSLPEVSEKDGFYLVKGRESLTYKRLLRERTSKGKLTIARKAVRILGLIPTIRGVFITGALSMENTQDDSDIDLMIITKRNTLWTTRLLSYLLIKAFGLKTRKAGNKEQKDKLCLNIWLDESVLSWSGKDRNLYTAHEIAQIAPILNKDSTYEKFLQKNNWIKDFWPNAVRINKEEYKESKSKQKLGLIEKLAFQIQYKYMKGKITREIVKLHKAIFHPNDWGEAVLKGIGS